MARHAARHRARRPTAAAASVFESFAVAAGALSVVALMTFIAGGPASVDGSITGDRGGSKLSPGTPSAGLEPATSGPRAPAGPLSTSPVDVRAALPTTTPGPLQGVLPVLPADAAAPGVQLTTPPGSDASSATPTVRVRPTTAVRPTRPVTPTPSFTPGKPTKSPKPVPSGKPTSPGDPPVTPGIPPRSRPGPTP